jgi:hypothetical protein
MAQQRHLKSNIRKDTDGTPTRWARRQSLMLAKRLRYSTKYYPAQEMGAFRHRCQTATVYRAQTSKREANWPSSVLSGCHVRTARKLVDSGKNTCSCGGGRQGRFHDCGELLNFVVYTPALRRIVPTLVFYVCISVKIRHTCATGNGRMHQTAWCGKCTRPDFSPRIAFFSWSHHTEQ